VKKNEKLDRDLEMAHMDVLCGAYLAYLYVLTGIAAIICTVVAIFVFAISLLNANTWGIVVGLFILLIPFVIYFLIKTNPSSKAKSMAREMDALLPYAVNFVAAMAAANATPQKIFRSLAIQENIYGSISKDSAWIYRDTAVLGMDMLTALKRSVKRAPSDKYKEFIQGVINTLTSGGNMKSYFQNRAEFYMRMNRREQEQFLETLAFMAESYVVVAVAMPIFLMVILVIMYWVSGSGAQISDMALYAVIFGLLPLIHGGYIATIYLITPKV
jgi:flagellar protein FlaJ